MAENLSNDFSTTLSGAIDNAVTSLTVASSTGAPATNFRARIDNEIVLVTNVSGTTWTVTRGVEGTIAASHSSGATVIHVVTAGALDARYARLDSANAYSAAQTFGAATHEKSNAIAASAIDLRLGNFFTKTISTTTTFTVSNVPASGTVASFILELTDGGAATVNWFSGVKWAGGTAPTLTASGVDILGFYTLDGGTTWRGLVLAKDSK